MTDLPFDRPGRFWRGNVHTHSDRSDGALTPEDTAAYYRDAGYDFLAITDHFRATFGFPVTDTRALRSSAFTTLPGAELHARGPRPARSHDVRLDGDHLTVRCSPARKVMVTGGRPGPRLVEGDAPTEGTVSVEMFRGTWCRVTVQDADGGRAWSNPIRV